MKYSYIEAIFLILLLTLTDAADWPQFKCTPDRQGYSPTENITLPASLCAWFYFGAPIVGSPAIVAGKAYCMAENGLLACIDLNGGKVLWSRKLPGTSNESSPAVDNGKVYIGTTAGRFYVLNATNGDSLKTYDAGGMIFAAPLLLPSGVYFGSYGGVFHALDLDGNLKWRDTSRLNIVRAAAGKDGIIVYADGDNGLHWISDSGDRAFHIKDTMYSTLSTVVNNSLSGFVSNPVWYGDTIYIGTAEAELISYWTGLLLIHAKTGQIIRRWSPGALPGISYGGASIDAATGRVFWATIQSGLLCNNSLWSSGPFPGSVPLQGLYGVNSAPAVTANCVIFGAEQNSDTGGCTVNFYNKTNGSRLWSYHPASHKAISSPVAVSDGRVLVGSMDGSLYGFWSGTPVTTPVNVDAKGSTGTSAANLSRCPGEWTLTALPNPATGNSVELLSSALQSGSRLSIFDLRGRLVRTLRGGGSAVRWNLIDNTGRTVGAGTYLVQVTTGDGKKLQTFNLRIIR